MYALPAGSLATSYFINQWSDRGGASNILECNVSVTFVCKTWIYDSWITSFMFCVKTTETES